eukprot:5976764-Prorocentrum_lima.AAC.1
MTSSLVGSEMCIRDSFGTLPDQLSGPFATCHGGELHTDENDRATDLQTCLLYTSDAADDM